MFYLMIRKILKISLEMRYIYIVFIINVSMAFVFKPAWQNEGVGARVIRVIGNQNLPRLDPFLMLDFFHVKLPAGFPDHPHRGFQTITYMLQGKFYHEDFKGHKGIIGPGDIQWMTAGRGIMHSEMPASEEETSVGFQLWLNLKSNKKMVEPKYQEYTKNQIPIFEKDGVKVKIICGEWQGNKGLIKYETPAYYMDVHLPPNGKFQIPIQKSWNSIIFVFQGNAEYQNQKVNQNQCCVLEKSQNSEIIHKITSEFGSKFLVIAGLPLNEPISSHGPFVMNTQEEIQQTFKDYQMGKNGFENAHQWESKIKLLAKGAKYEEL